MEENQINIYDGFKEESALSDVFSASGMFPDIKSKAQALVKILAGKELGISPFEAMASIYIIGGKLALTSKAMATLIKKSPNYDYRIDKLDEKECTISFYEINSETETKLGESSFTFADAAKAGLVNKDVWKNYPRNLLFARALSNGCRWYLPHVISGYYTTEELGDIEITPTKNTVELTADGEVTIG